MTGTLAAADALMPLRVAVIADYAEERWPSMDLVADMLMAHFAAEHADTIDATLVRPTMPRWIGGPGDAAPPTLDRMAARLLHYPRVLQKLTGTFHVYHVVDHSYAHLVHSLPAGRTMVTCHDAPDASVKLRMPATAYASSGRVRR